MLLRFVPVSHSVKELVDETGVSNIHSLRLLNATAMDNPEAYKNKDELERLYRIHQKEDLRAQTEYIKRIEAIGIVINKKLTRQLDTVVHEESGPSDYSGEESNDDEDEAISIAASDAISKLAGSSSTSAPKSKATPPLAMRTRGKIRNPEPQKAQSQQPSKATPSKIQATRRGSTLKSKQPSILDQGRSTSPQNPPQRTAPGPIRPSRAIGVSNQDSDEELSEFSTPEFTALPYYKQLKLRIAHQNAKHTQHLNQTLAQLVSSNQKMVQQLEYVTARQDTFQNFLSTHTQSAGKSLYIRPQSGQTSQSTAASLSSMPPPAPPKSIMKHSTL